MPQATPLLIGVDGGGSGCRFAVADSSGRLLALREEPKPANIATDFNGALDLLHSGLSALWSTAKQPAETLPSAACCLGLAGANVSELGARVQSALPFSRCLVGDDRLTSVAGALGPTQDGSVISVGTGSFICHRTNGETRSLGGCGFLLGDDASGAWLGHQILRRAARFLEGLIPVTPLIHDVAATFENDLQAMIHFSLRAVPRDYAEFAPRVFDHAANDDVEGRRLVLEGVGYLLDALGVFSRPEGEPIVLLGGAARRYADFLPEGMRADLREARGSALSGALMQAAHLAGLPDAEIFAF